MESAWRWDRPGVMSGSSMSPTGRPSGGVESLAFHPDGNVLAVGAGDGEVSFWELPSDLGADPDACASRPQLIRRIKVCQGPCMGVAYSADGSRLFVAGAQPILVIVD